MGIGKSYPEHNPKECPTCPTCPACKNPKYYWDVRVPDIGSNIPGTSYEELWERGKKLTGDQTKIKYYKRYQEGPTGVCVHTSGIDSEYTNRMSCSTIPCGKGYTPVNMDGLIVCVRTD
jgi:hypothetical protein